MTRALEIIESHRAEPSAGEVLPLQDHLDRLQRVVAYRFRDRGLLEQAMTHTSWAHESGARAVAAAFDRLDVIEVPVDTADLRNLNQPSDLPELPTDHGIA